MGGGAGEVHLSPQKFGGEGGISLCWPEGRVRSILLLYCKVLAAEPGTDTKNIFLFLIYNQFSPYKTYGKWPKTGGAGGY